MGKKLFKLEAKGRNCKESCAVIHKDDKLEIKSKTLSLKICKDKCKRELHINIPSVEDGVIAQFNTLGNVGLVPITPGQPITFTTTDVANNNIVLSNSISSPFTISGSFFNIKKKGSYQVNFHVPYLEDASVILAIGQTIATLTALGYTLVGKTTGDFIDGSFIVNIPNDNYYLALLASSANTVPIVIPALSSTGNASNTSISFIKL